MILRTPPALDRKKGRPTARPTAGPAAGPTSPVRRPEAGKPAAPEAPAAPAAAAAAASPGYVLEDQVGHLLRRAHQRHAALFAHAFAAHALTPTQWAVLARLAAQGAMPQNLLGRATAMDPATIQGVVRRLMARGLVGRARNPADRRHAMLALTEAGRRCYDAALDAASQVSDATLAPIDPAERARFLALLRLLA